jgi:hypothetical protein
MKTLHSRRGYVRYNIRHSILPEGTIGGVFVPPGQRLSIMMRVCLPIPVSHNPLCTNMRTTGYAWHGGIFGALSRPPRCPVPKPLDTS